MDKEYSFDWLKEDVDSSIIFILRSGNEALGSYQVGEILTNGIDNVPIKFANISDLDNFVNLAMIRFVDWGDTSNFIDIPIRNLAKLYAGALNFGEEDSKGIAVNDLQAFSIYDGSVANKGYAIYAYRVNEESQELKIVMSIASKYGSLSMNQKIDALEEINLLNYQRNKNNNKTKK